jgi:hypothetical protein
MAKTKFLKVWQNNRKKQAKEADIFLTDFYLLCKK